MRARVDVPGDVAEVRAADLLRRGVAAAAEQPDEELLAVSLLEGGVDELRRRALLERRVARREDAARHRHEVRREVDDRHLPREVRDGLLDLRRVAVVCHIVGAEVVVELREVVGLLRRAARARDARLRVDDDRIDIDEMRARERREREDAGRREAASVADDLGIADLVAVELREAVDALGFRIRVRHVVPRLVDTRIAEAVVSAEIDDAHRQVPERAADLHRMAVRQADEDEIAVLADGLDVLHALEHHVVAASQVRVEIRDLLARVALGCDMHDFCLRMIVEDAQELGSRVSRCSQDTDFHTSSSSGARPLELMFIIIHLRCIILQAFSLQFYRFFCDPSHRIWRCGC